MQVHASLPQASRRASIRERVATANANRILDDEDGFSGMVTTLIGAAVGLLVLAAILPLVFQGTNEATTSLNDPNVTTGSDEADSLKGVYAIVLGFGAVLFIGAIAFGFVKFRGGGM